MPDITVKMPDGNSITFPEGTDQATMARVSKQYWDERPDPAATNPSADPKDGYSVGGFLKNVYTSGNANAVGLAKAALGAGKFIATTNPVAGIADAGKRLYDGEGFMDASQHAMDDQWSNIKDAASAVGEGVVGGLKSIGQDIAHPINNFYNRPAGMAMDVATVAEPTLAGASKLTAKVGAGLEHGGVNLLSHTLGRATENKAGLLEDSRTLLENRITRNPEGQTALAQKIAPLAQAKTGVLESLPPRTLSADDFSQLQTLIAEKQGMTPNSAKPLNAAQGHFDALMTDPNLFTKETRSLSGDEVNQMMRDAAGDPARTQQVIDQLSSNPQQTVYTPRDVGYPYLEKLKQDAQASVAEKKGFVRDESLSPDIDALRAKSQDWRNIVSAGDPRIEPLNEQLAPLYSAQKQLNTALNSTTTPHYGSAGAIVGGIAGGATGHFMGGHALYGTGIGGTIGASLASNPYSLMSTTAQGMFETGKGLQKVSGPLNAMRPSSLLGAERGNSTPTTTPPAGAGLQAPQGAPQAPTTPGGPSSPAPSPSAPPVSPAVADVVQKALASNGGKVDMNLIKALQVAGLPNDVILNITNRLRNGVR